MLLITKVEIGSDFEAWAESCISPLNNAPSWVRYPKEMDRLAGKCFNRQKIPFFIIHFEETIYFQLFTCTLFGCCLLNKTLI